jgi:hypothetical protein
MNVACPFSQTYAPSRKNRNPAIRLVTIHGGVCDSTDRCELTETCPFHDDSREATRRFIEAYCEATGQGGAAAEVAEAENFRRRFPNSTQH